jgi:hypothetical protein
MNQETGERDSELGSNTLKKYNIKRGIILEILRNAKSYAKHPIGYPNVCSFLGTQNTKSLRGLHQVVQLQKQFRLSIFGKDKDVDMFRPYRI